jgi:trimeric autotransporter adhesin
VLSPTVLLAVIPATALTTAGTLNIVAGNPSPGGDSTPASFTVASTPTVQAVVSAASNSGVLVSPGELITMYGANIGPATAAGMADADADGFVDTTLGGFSVTIDGQPAPLLYVSANQISAQVPYAATVGAARAISITNGSTTATGAVDIGAAAPGIFTLDGSGAGQAAALNFNATTSTYSVNQANNPAKLGDTIVLYITGEGDYATSIAQRTGLLIPASLTPLPQLSPTPTVTIGGAAATVQYAGPLVGSIIGLMQLNVVVPSNATTGTAVPVLIQIGTVSSQSGVTLSIHP